LDDEEEIDLQETLEIKALMQDKPSVEDVK
jgi:hypothetical protein